jgi:hypothetical protein
VMFTIDLLRRDYLAFIERRGVPHLVRPAGLKIMAGLSMASSFITNLSPEVKHG